MSPQPVGDDDLQKAITASLKHASGGAQNNSDAAIDLTAEDMQLQQVLEASKQSSGNGMADSAQTFGV